MGLCGHFLRETVGRSADTPGPADNSAMRADSGFYTNSLSSPSAASRMSVSPSPSASTKACGTSSSPYPRRAGHPYPIGWTAPPTWRRPATLPFRVSPTLRRRLIVRRVKPAPGSQLALLATYSYHPSSPTGMGKPWNLRPPSPPRKSRTPYAPQVRRRSQPSPVGPFRRQRRLAGGPGDCPGPLDGADRSGRAGGDHQDPPAALYMGALVGSVARQRRLILDFYQRLLAVGRTQFTGCAHRGMRVDPAVVQPDRGAPLERFLVGPGNRSTILALIHQSVKDLSHSRHTNRPARVPCCLRPPHFGQIALGGPTGPAAWPTVPLPYPGRTESPWASLDVN